MRSAGWRGKNTERGSRYARNIPVLYIKTGEKDYKEAQEGDGKGLLIKMVIVRSHAWHLGNWLLTVT